MPRPVVLRSRELPSGALEAWETYSSRVDADTSMREQAASELGRKLRELIPNARHIPAQKREAILRQTHFTGSLGKGVIRFYTKTKMRGESFPAGVLRMWRHPF